MKAPNNARGMEDDKASHYNNMFAPLNCVGGSEQGCEPFAVSLSLSLSLSVFSLQSKRVTCGEEDTYTKPHLTNPLH